MANQLDLIPRVTIHPDKICLYKETKWIPTKTSSKFKMDVDNEQTFENSAFYKSDRKNNGYLSTHARRKIFKSIDYLLITSDKKKVYSKVQKKYVTFKIVFVTLTLPSTQIHTDREITNTCLNQFFIEISKYHNVKKYVWRAEKQENGNIHYHILINEFIEYSVLRKRWNRICNKLGYVDRYQEKMKEYFKNGFRPSQSKFEKRTIDQQRKAYILGQKSDWTSPNSTDIHDTRKIIDIKNYVGKYMAKQIDIKSLKESKNPKINQKALEKYTEIDFEAFEKDPDLNVDEIMKEMEKLIVKSRLWSCSQNLSNIEGCQLVEDWEISDELEKVAERSQCKIYRDTYFSVLFVDCLKLTEYGSKKLFNYFADYLIKKFNYHLQVKLAI